MMWQKNKLPKQRRLSQEGFTIIELMIALSVLSVILLMSTMILMQIGVLYTKGVNASTLQNANRSVQDDVASAIRLGSNTPIYSDPVDVGGGLVENAVCIGTTRYTYVLDRELGKDTGTSPVLTTHHVLWKDTMSASGTCAPVGNFDQSGTPNDGSGGLDPSPGNGYEMAPFHTRLTLFDLSQVPSSSSLYNVDVWTAYGDSDLVHTDSTTGHSTCQSGAGDQFCAVSEISSTISRRLPSQ